MASRESRPCRQAFGWRAVVAASMLVAFCLAAWPAFAQTGDYDVPAQRLDQALRRVAQVSGVQILFTPQAVAGLRSGPVRGRMSPRQALERAIQGHGLQVTEVGPNAYALSSVQQPRRRPPTAAAIRSEPQAMAPTPLAEVVVTGALAGEVTRKAETAYAVTVISEGRLRSIDASSLAGVVALTPGYWVESSGGEASNNIRARGVPLDGYSSVAVLEDGLPVQHDAGVGFLNPDQLFRPGMGLARIEVLRGGPAAVLASQAPGGLINAINRTPPDTPEGQVRVQSANYGGIRIEGFGGAPLGEGRVSLDGFWREDEGVRGTDFTANRGGSARLAFARKVGGTDLEIALKRIDDRVAFFLPVPLRQRPGGGIESIDGFDARRGTLLGPDLLAFEPNARQDPAAPPFTISDGTRVRLTQATLKASWELDQQGLAEVRLSARSADTARHGLFPSGLQPATTRAAAALTQAKILFPTAERVSYRVASSPSHLAAVPDAPIIQGLASTVSAPLDEVLSSFNLSGQGAAFGADLRWTVGAYGAYGDYGFRRLSSAVLLEAQENARRLDLVVLDAGGAILGALTDGGVVRYGVQYDNAEGRQTTLAAFGAGDLDLGSTWTLDFGARWEGQRQWGSVELAAPVDLGGAMIADDAVLQGTGEHRGFDARHATINATLGLRRRLTDDTHLFARLSRSERLPSVSQFYGDPSGLGVRKAPTVGLDLGLSLERPRIALYAVVFRTAFDGFPFNETLVNPVTGFVEATTSFATSLTTGLELETRLEPTPWLALDGSLTFQNPVFDEFEARVIRDGLPVVQDFSGRQLIRVPKLMVRLASTVTLPNRDEAGLVVEHFGERFSDAANTTRLPSYTVLSGHYSLALSERVRLTFTGANLTDTLGLTEGNPRAGQLVSADAHEGLFTARPIFGRTIRAAIAVSF